MKRFLDIFYPIAGIIMCVLLILVVDPTSDTDILKKIIGLLGVAVILASLADMLIKRD